MVGLVGETLLCTDTIYRKKNPVYTVTRSCKHLPCAHWKPSEGCPESATVTSIFSQYVPARSRFPSVPLPLPPSTFLTIRLWRSRPLLGHDWMRHGATQILCLHTHMLKSVANVMEFKPRFVPIRAHPEDNSITMRLLIRSGLPKHRRGVLPQSRNLLLFVATSLVTTMVIWWRGD